MAMDDQWGGFEEVRQRAKRRLVLLDHIEAALKTDPTYIAELLAVLGSSTRGRSAAPETTLAGAAPKRGRPASGALEAIKRALSDSDWLSSKEIQDAAGLTKSQFFTSVKGAVEGGILEVRTHPNHARAQQWRLKRAD